MIGEESGVGGRGADEGVKEGVAGEEVGRETDNVSGSGAFQIGE